MTDVSSVHLCPHHLATATLPATPITTSTCFLLAAAVPRFTHASPVRHGVQSLCVHLVRTCGDMTGVHTGATPDAPFAPSWAQPLGRGKGGARSVDYGHCAACIDWSRKALRDGRSAWQIRQRKRPANG